jgi:predicted transcriptional regulator YdeE
VESSRIEIVSLEEKCFIGIPATCAFKSSDREAIKVAGEAFASRKGEISGAVNEREYVCPHFANDILFTYIYCMEVENLEEIPHGMIGFRVPSQRYVKVRSEEHNPYKLVNSYLAANGLESNTSSLALEVFKFGEEQHFNNADIYVPIV